MNKIPRHKISERLNGEVAKLKYLSKDSLHIINYPHRDDYYIFFLVEKGGAKLLIDFKEYDIQSNAVYYILPEQVHFLIDYNMDTSAWVLIVDSSLVNDEYKDIFENGSLVKSKTALDDATINNLHSCISILHQRLHAERQAIGQSILHNLLASYIGMIAEIYQKSFPFMANKRKTLITTQFKSLLSANYKSLKSPSQYAYRMNISPVYLNEAVKETTGLTVTECIRNEIIIRAKRLLFYSNLSIKEIALELGYEDWAYFTRMFTKASLLSPTQFRTKYLK